MYRHIDSKYYSQPKYHQRSKKGKGNEGSFAYENLNRVITSSVLLILSFVITELTLNSFITALAKFRRFYVEFSYNRLHILPEYSSFWSLYRVTAIYFVPALACLFISVLLYNYMTRVLVKIGTFRLFIFWLTVCFSNIFWAHLFFAPLGIDDRTYVLYRTFAIVATWAKLTPLVMSVFSIVAFVMSLLTGWFIAVELLMFSPAWDSEKDESAKSTALGQLFFIPWVIALIPLLLLCSKDNFLVTIFMLVNLLVIGVGMFLGTRTYISIAKPERHSTLDYFPLVLVVIVVFVWLLIYMFLR